MIGSAIFAVGAFIIFQSLFNYLGMSFWRTWLQRLLEMRYLGLLLVVHFLCLEELCLKIWEVKNFLLDGGKYTRFYIGWNDFYSSIILFQWI